MANLFVTPMVYPGLKKRLDYSGVNYVFWISDIEQVLNENHVAYVLNDPIPNKKRDPEAHKKFLDDDFTARHIVLGSLDEDLFLSYHNHKTAKSLLDSLIEFFHKPSMAKRMTLWKQYVGNKMSEYTGEVEDHVHKMQSMAVDLDLEGVNVPEDLQAVLLMNSLPRSMASRLDQKEMNLHEVVESVMKTEVCKLDFFNSLSLNDEIKLVSGFASCSCCGGSGSGSGSSSSRSSRRGSSFKGNCYNCGGYGHRHADCPFDAAAAI